MALRQSPEETRLGSLKIRLTDEIANSWLSQQSPGFIMTHRGNNEGVTRS
jgi:hypothetical protein